MKQVSQDEGVSWNPTKH